MKIGFKVWSTNVDLFEAANELYRSKKIDYIEMYIVPKSFDKSTLETLNLPIVIHNPHYGHGFNMSDVNLFDKNIRLFNETIKFADFFDSKDIIIHPGYGGDIQTCLRFLEKTDDPRIVIENMPKRTHLGVDFVGYDFDSIKSLMNEKYGFCLDFAHAAKAAVSVGVDYKDYIKKLLKLKPKLFHLSDGNLDNEIDEHLNFGEGEFDIGFFRECIGTFPQARGTLETPRDNMLTFNSDINNLKSLISLPNDDCSVNFVEMRDKIP